MRLISQTECVDVPYENTILTVCSDGRILATVFSSEEDFVFAIYSTKEKALKVMEMVRNAYTGSSLTVLKDYSTEYAKRMMELLKKSNAVIIENGNKQPEFHHCVRNTIFQFPKDEDVEV